MDKYQGEYFSIETTNKRDDLNSSNWWHTRRLRLNEPLNPKDFQSIIKETEGFDYKEAPEGYATKIFEITERKFLPDIFGNTKQKIRGVFDETNILYIIKIVPLIIEYGEEFLGWDETDKGARYLKFPYLAYCHAKNKL